MFLLATVSAVVASATASIGIPLFYMSRSPKGIETKVYNDRGYNDYVILLHGLGQVPQDLRRLRKRLCSEDYCVVTIGYPSNTHRSIYIGENLLPGALSGFLKNEQRKVNFVTYSLGGIVLRTFLRRYEIFPSINKIVMISPPNHGTPIATFFSQFKAIKKVVGPALDDLSDKHYGFTHSLPQHLSYDLGIIAGDLIAPFIDQNDSNPQLHTDGCVSVLSAQLEGIQDFVVLPKLHFSMARSEKVFDYVSSFLNSGSFKYYSI